MRQHLARRPKTFFDVWRGRCALQRRRAQRAGFIRAILLVVLTSGVGVVPAFASFHFMQIEQVIGGVNGDTSAQAIQLRMRAGNQNQMQLSRLVVFDAAGLNPIVVGDPNTSVSGTAFGSRVLFATDAFLSQTTPTTVPDFPMVNTIPASYLAAGSLAFQNSSGSTTYWRLSWGGASYTGGTTGSTTNDFDGDFGPPFAGPLPSNGLDALQFRGNASAVSTSNDVDYAVTSGGAVFTNNSGETFTVDGATDARPRPRLALYPNYPNPFNARTTVAFELPRAHHVRVQVYSTRGRLLDTLIDQQVPAGRQTLVWNGLDSSGRVVGSGTYLVRLSTPQGTQTRTITLVK